MDGSSSPQQTDCSKIYVPGTDYELILRCVTGSHLYGINFAKGENPLDPNYESDEDYRGIFLAPVSAKVGLLPYPDHIDVETEEDTVYYEARKFVSMALDNNPVILDILFADPDSIQYASPKARLLLDNRHLFLSKRIKDSFLGYARQQIGKLQGHKRWLDQYPQIHEVFSLLKRAFEARDIDYPWIGEFFTGSLAREITGLDEKTKVSEPTTLSPRDVCTKYGFSQSFDEFRRYMAPSAWSCSRIRAPESPDIVRPVSLADLPFLETQATFRQLSRSEYLIYEGGQGVLTRSGALRTHSPKDAPKDEATRRALRWILSLDELRYDQQCRHHRHVWDWFLNRSKRRSELERRFQYDTKYASHVLRILCACRDIMQTCTYAPRLSAETRELVLGVRLGKYTHDEYLALIEELRAEIEALFPQCNLPDQPDTARVNELLVQVSCESTPETK